MRVDRGNCKRPFWCKITSSIFRTGTIVLTTSIPITPVLSLSNFPTGLKLSNTPFKASYLAGVPKIDKEIQQALKARKSRPQAILKKEAGGLSDFKFTDDLGQLLVKRTILLLYAGEEARAWQELEADVKKYYQSSRWLPELKRDIQE